MSSEAPQEQLHDGAPLPSGISRRLFLGMVGAAASAMLVGCNAPSRNGAAPTQTTSELTAPQPAYLPIETLPEQPTLPIATLAPDKPAVTTTTIPVPPKRKHAIPYSYDEYFAAVKDLPPKPLLQMAADIQITKDAGGKLSDTTKEVLSRGNNEQGVMNHIVAYETAGIDSAKALQDWQNIFSIIDDPNRASEIRSIQDHVFSLAFSSDNGTLKLYDPANPAAAPLYLYDYVYGQLANQGVTSAQPDFKQQFDSLSLTLLKNVRDGLNADTALALSAYLQSRRIDMQTAAASSMATFKDIAAQTVSSLSGDFLSEDAVRERFENMPVQVYDHYSELAQNPSSPAPNFGGYYNAGNPDNGTGEFFTVNVDNYLGGSDDTILHELGGHGLSGVIPVKQTDGSTIIRRRSGVITFIEHVSETESRWTTGNYGSWFNEAMANFIPIEISAVTTEGAIQPESLAGELEVRLLLTLINAQSGPTDIDSINSYTTYKALQTAPEQLAARVALAKYYYAHRSTEGPQGFSQVEYPFKDDSVVARKEVVKNIDGAFGPGLFNRINLVMAKAESFDPGPNGPANGGHTGFDGLSAQVVHSIVEALHNDTNHLAAGIKLSLSANISLPWLHKPATEKESTLDAPAYAPYSQKYPVTHSVLNALLAATSADDFTTTLGMIKDQIGGPRTTTPPPKG
jgi:hypothetical protein